VQERAERINRPDTISFKFGNTRKPRFSHQGRFTKKKITERKGKGTGGKKKKKERSEVQKQDHARAMKFSSSKMWPCNQKGSGGGEEGKGKEFWELVENL